LTADGALYII